MIEGGCFCGKVRYAIEEGAYRSVDCHCTMCRHIHAAPYVTWIVVPAHQFNYGTEAPTRLASSANGTRYFCPSCGTHVACINTEHPELVDVSVGSLDFPETFNPTAEIFTDTRLSWVHSRGLA
ncbi:MAG: GFA family protein [Gammaproteobacteria bacterium]